MNVVSILANCLYLEVKYIRNAKQEETCRPKEMGQTHKAFNIGFNFQEADGGLTDDVSKVQTIKRDVYKS